jgi:hypothetical protein
MDSDCSLKPQNLSIIRSSILGVLSCVIIVYLIESVGHFLYPLSSPLNSNLDNDILILKTYVKDAIFVVMLFPLCSYVLGAFVGGFIANHFSKKMIPSLYVGLCLLALILIALKIIPHPKWYVFTSCFIPIPSALLGAYTNRLFFSIK